MTLSRPTTGRTEEEDVLDLEHSVKGANLWKTLRKTTVTMQTLAGAPGKRRLVSPSTRSGSVQETTETTLENATLERCLRKKIGPWRGDNEQ